MRCLCRTLPPNHGVECPLLGGFSGWRRTASTVSAVQCVSTSAGIVLFRPFIPYIVAIVQLDEGPRILGAMLGLETPIAIGDRVQPRIETIDDERAMLLFEPENGR
ncbi:hypothetical protein C2W62_44820 [Candidatus Entotheonella serta]|nr:hypothetical protein C2W62_44820 [Candidatus Entotheonella serta]